MIASLDFSGIASILSRYVHLLCACLLVGGVFLLSCMFKARGQAGSSDEPVFLRGRRVVKMVVHIGLLFILASGAYNLMLNWVAYGRNIPLTHALLGMHLLLGLLALTLLLITLVGKSPGDREGKRLWVVVWVLFLAVMMASSLKYAREHPKVVSATSHPTTAP